MQTLRTYESQPWNGNEERMPVLSEPFTGTESHVVTTVDGRIVMEGKAARPPKSELEIIALYSMIYGSPRSRGADFDKEEAIKRRYIKSILPKEEPAPIPPNDESAVNGMLSTWDAVIISVLSGGFGAIVTWLYLHVFAAM